MAEVSARVLLHALPMPRVARRHLVSEGSTNHTMWQTHNLEHAFDVEGAREYFRKQLLKYKREHGVLILSYVLMGTHPHVVCRSELGQEHFSKFWKKVNQAFARWYNTKQGRRGQVVMERLASPRVQDDAAVLRVMRYVDRNPVEAGLVRSPKDWAFSSHAHYAYGRPDPLIDDAPQYLALGRTPAERRKAYLHLFAGRVEEDADPRKTYECAAFIGDAAWVDRMKRSLRETARGRPP